jgi:hypothetical protein
MTERSNRTKKEGMSLLSTNRLNEVVAEHMYLIKGTIKHHWIPVHESFALGHLEEKESTFFFTHFFDRANWNNFDVKTIAVPQLHNQQVQLEKRQNGRDKLWFVRLRPPPNVDYSNTKRVTRAQSRKSSSSCSSSSTTTNNNKKKKPSSNPTFTSDFHENNGVNCSPFSKPPGSRARKHEPSRRPDIKRSKTVLVRQIKETYDLFIEETEELIRLAELLAADTTKAKE